MEETKDKDISRIDNTKKKLDMSNEKVHVYSEKFSIFYGDNEAIIEKRGRCESAD